MEISDASIDARREMGQESSGMELWPQHKNQNIQSRWKTKKKMGDEINGFLRPEETEETKGNDVRNNDTWIKMAKDQNSWKQTESEFAMTAAASPGARTHRGNRAAQHDDPPARYFEGRLMESGST